MEGPSHHPSATVTNCFTTMMTSRSILICTGMLALILTGCLPASRMATKGPTATESQRTIERSRTSTSLDYDRRKVLAEAEGWLGTPYQFGGTTRSGVDCSGLVWNVFNTIDRRLPRNSAEQAGVGVSISLSQALPGDLVFFNTSGSGVSHVGIMVDNDAFVHASTSNGVTVSRLSESYYGSHFLFLRRVID